MWVFGGPRVVDLIVNNFTLSLLRSKVTHSSESFSFNSVFIILSTVMLYSVHQLLFLKAIWGKFCIFWGH